MNKIAVLTSGGLDSCVMLSNLCRTHEAYPLYVQCGLAWEEAEQEQMSEFLCEMIQMRKVKMGMGQSLRIPMDDVYSYFSWYMGKNTPPKPHDPDKAFEIPGRNIILLSKAAVWCVEHRVQDIAIGTLCEDAHPDSTAHFVSELARIYSMGLGIDLHVIQPLRGLTKAEVIKMGVELNVPFELTMSCVAPSCGRHCGKCGKCFERQEGFRQAGVEDPTIYRLVV